MAKTITLPFTTSHAFIIGINAYTNGVSRLTTAVKDAQDIAKLLGEAHGYIIHDEYDATKAQMLALFEKMKTTVKAEDRVIFYFAGHGIALDSEKDPEGFLVPSDADPKQKETLLSMNVLHETLHALECKHGLLVLDCCFAGAFKWSTGFRDTLFNLTEVLYEERFYRFVEHPAWQVITSAAHDQKALDIIEEDVLGKRETAEADINSPFAKALKQAINLEGKADVVRGKRSDGVITASELYLYLRDIVETESQKRGKRQSPSIFNLSKHDKGEFIFLHPGHSLNLEKAPETNPFRGLNPYQQADARFFFGRDAAIEEMLNKLTDSPILVVSAPSGQGKSSAVRAGLFPQLKTQGFKQFHIIQPGAQPDLAFSKLPEIDHTVPQVLLIDQFEEFYSDAAYSEAHENFEMRLIELLDMVSKAESQLKIVITIRSDFEWQLKSSLFGLAFWDDVKVREFLYRLPPMTWEELKQMIEKPLFVATYDFEFEEMTDRILEEINNAPGALPLLSFTMQQLYELRDKTQRLLTLDAYTEKLGGINGALSTHADRIYNELPSDAHRDIMRKLMLRMVRLNDGSYSRRRVYKNYQLLNGHVLNELDYPDHLDKTVEDVLKILQDALLLIQKDDDNGTYVVPMHDSLINFWPTCLGWIKNFGRENLELQRQLWQSVIEHHAWEEPLFSYGSDDPHAGKPAAPLWDNNPKLQQVQLVVTDPKNEWLCTKGWANKSVSSVSYLLWDKTPSQQRLAEMAAWNWFFKEEEDTERYQKIQEQMDHWLNEKEVAFVKKSFEEQRSEIEKIRKERDDAQETLKDLQSATENIVKDMLVEADQHILKLRYQEALQRVRDAEKIQALPAEVARRMIELALFFGEFDTELAIELAEKAADLSGSTRAKRNLQSAREAGDAFRPHLHTALANMAPTWFDLLIKRYFHQMVSIQGGKFEMGDADQQEPYAFPAFQVTLSDFQLAATQVTFWQYHLYCQVTKEDRIDRIEQNRTELQLSLEITGDNPVVGINWYQAVKYANWMNRRAGHEPIYLFTDNLLTEVRHTAQGYRLPTEAEWEYAAAGGTKGYDEAGKRKFLFIGTSDESAVGSFTWSKENSRSRTHPVATKNPNPLGLYDMGGNVWEWNQNWFIHPYPDSAKRNPVTRIPEKPAAMVLRGGSWNHPMKDCRAIPRIAFLPKDPSNNIGFRLAFSQEIEVDVVN